MNAMVQTVGLQLGATLLAALGAGCWAGWQAAGAATLGGLIYALPSGLFALRLTAESSRAGGARPAVFLVGKFAKLGIALGLLVAVPMLWPGVPWLPFLAGLAAALHANFFAFLIRT